MCSQPQIGEIKQTTNDIKRKTAFWALTTRVLTPAMLLITPTVLVLTLTMPLITPTMRVLTPTMLVLTPTMLVLTLTMPLITPTMCVLTPTMPLITLTMPLLTPTMRVLTPTMRVLTLTMPLITPTVLVLTPTMPLLTPTVPLLLKQVGGGSMEPARRRKEPAALRLQSPSCKGKMTALILPMATHRKAIANTPARATAHTMLLHVMALLLRRMTVQHYVQLPTYFYLLFTRVKLG